MRAIVGVVAVFVLGCLVGGAAVHHLTPKPEPARPWMSDADLEYWRHVIEFRDEQPLFPVESVTPGDSPRLPRKAWTIFRCTRPGALPVVQITPCDGTWDGWSQRASPHEARRWLEELARVEGRLKLEKARVGDPTPIRPSDRWY